MTKEQHYTNILIFCDFLKDDILLVNSCLFPELNGFYSRSFSLLQGPKTGHIRHVTGRVNISLRSVLLVTCKVVNVLLFQL